MKRQYIVLKLTVLLWFHLPLVFSDVPKSNGQTAAPESGTSTRGNDADVRRIKAQILEKVNDPKIGKLDLDEISSHVTRLHDENILNLNDINDILAEITRKKLETVPQADVLSQPLDTKTTDRNLTQKKTSSDSSSSRSVKGRTFPDRQGEFPRRNNVMPIVTMPLVNNDDQGPVEASGDHVILESMDMKKQKDPIERIPNGESNAVPNIKTGTQKSNSNSAGNKNTGQLKSNENPGPKPKTGPQKTNGNPGAKPKTGPQKANGNPGAKQNKGPKKANGSPGPKPNTATQNAKKNTGPKAKSDKKNPTKDNKDPILPVKVMKNVGKFVGGFVG